MNRPRVVHVTTTDMSLSLLLGNQLGAFIDAGYEIVGVSAPGDYVDGLTSRGVTHVPLRHSTRSMAPHRDAAAFVELRKILRQLRPDIVHTHNPKPGIYGRLAARAERVPAVVNTVHGLYALREDGLSRRAVVYGLERIAASCSHAELVQNPEDLELLLRIGVPSEKLHLLGNGVDLARFRPGAVEPGHVDALRAELGIEDGEVVCGLVGRLVWEKGYREVFEAAARLRRQAPNVRVVVAGPPDLDKPDAITAEDMARAEREGNITFLGLRHDVEALYATMDIYVLASHREGFPRSAMEAAAMGVPVVATDIRGCRQVVEDGVNGFLAPVRDPQALAGAIARLAENRELRVQMGDAGVRKARREFDERAVVDRTLSVYEQLTRQRVAA